MKRRGCLMSKQKNNETITIKKSTFMILIAAALVILIGIGGIYYYSTLNKKTTGLEGTQEIDSIEPVELEITAITVPECKICMNMSQAVEELKQAPFIIPKQTNIIYATSDEAKLLIKEYDITKLPALILIGDTDTLPLNGFRNVKGGAVLDEVPPPYVDLTEKKIMGIVNLTYLTDNSCTECYDVEQHKDVMAYAFGMYVGNEEYIDISTPQGKTILEKYKITQVPTILLSQEADAYQMVQMLWDKIGTVEKDGTRVFRGFDMTNDVVYKDLETGQLVNTSQIQNQEE